MTVPQPAPLPASIPSPAGPQETPHIAPVGALLAVWIALLVLTLVTLLAARLPTEGLPAAGLWIAMGIATVKATLVALYFMHLRYDRPFLAIVFVTSLVFVMLFVGLALMDTVEYQPELIPGFAPALDYQRKLAVSARSIVAQGHNADFVKNAKEVSAVVAKTNAKGVLVSRIGLGGNPDEFITLVLFDSFDDIGKFSAAFAKASAEAKLAPLPAGTVAHSEWRVYRYLPALSITPAPQKAGNQ